MSQASGEAAKSTREVTSNVADQVGSVASDLAGKGREMASVASDQAKSAFAGIRQVRRVRARKHGPPQPHRGAGRRTRGRRADRLAGTTPKLMMFKTLKLFGLVIPAEIEAVRVSLELRDEPEADLVKQVAQEAVGFVRDCLHHSSDGGWHRVDRSLSLDGGCLACLWPIQVA
jgi:hypothetical protein